MWRTVEGIRTLTGAEAELIRVALDWAVAEIDDPLAEDDPYEFEVEVFDALDKNQKLALLSRVAKGLLNEAEPPPELTAVNEAAVAVLFEVVSMNIEIEVDFANRGLPYVGRSKYWWRRRAFAAGKQAGYEPYYDEMDDEDFPPPLTSYKCDDSDEWEFLLEAIKDGIFWDDDWTMTEILDDPPEVGAAVRAALTIDDEYFTSIAPDPTDAELVEIKRELRRICKAK